MPRRQLLLFPLPFQGHINPMFELAALLHSRSGCSGGGGGGGDGVDFSITILHTTTHPITSPMHPSYRYVSLAPVDDELSNSNCDRELPPIVEDVVLHIFHLNARFEASFRDRVAAMLEDAEEEPVACVIADAHWFAVHAAARRLGVPSVALRTGSAASFCSFMAYPLLMQKGYIPVKESELNEAVEEVPPMRVRDLPRVDQSDPVAVAELLAKVVAGVRNSSGLILNAAELMESAEVDKIRRELAHIQVFAIGPLHKFTPLAAQPNQLPPDRTCLAWLDAQPAASVLYVSFGSVASLPEKHFVETAFGLALSGRAFLWVVRPGSVRGPRGAAVETKLPEGFEETTRGRGRVVEWAPQQEVLRHRAVGAFWTHCGWNSTLEAISEGVPLICAPQFGDQMGNARYATRVWGIAAEVEGELWERGRIAAVIKAVMEGREGEEMRERARELKQKLSASVSRGGSSHAGAERLVEYLKSL
ncbi:DIMBOA UDP-glucosyltransferase BX8-like [Ananas comosus]|uniref:2,4-dihydroxy-7-methoxy-2H-1,4-benzoxazin-3(4H)-one 2-D-glucosyltransferase n=1 Tax=Ananas comosus TaxID=4615 RepID=A0A199VRY0_ANACO|nr:DIMBOA UDP-glucosyltransferase BX8-like [Ananas comosus]OAY79450.1 DIMBOA UDP-glucosyltransferase BX8 [Ananas comosus]